MSSQRVLITGGSGFIGTNLVACYLDQGCEVLNLDIAPPRNPAHQPCWQDLDIRDRPRFIQATRCFQPDIFLHFAARTDLDEKTNLDGYSANIDGVCHAIEAICRTPSITRAIFASSQLVCRLGYQPVDEHDYCPTTLYGRSKVLTEKIIRLAADFGPAWTILRPTSIWGPWFDVPYKNFFLAILRNLYLHPAGVHTLKQWGFVGNTVYQVDRLLDHPAAAVHAKTLYLADYPPHNLHDFANRVQAALGARPIRNLPARWMQAVARLGDLLQKLGWRNPPLTTFRYRNIVTSEVQDLQPLQDLVGALPYSLQQGVEITAAWLKAHSH